MNFFIRPLSSTGSRRPPKGATTADRRTRSFDYIAVISLLAAFTISDFQLQYAAGFPVLKWYVLIGFVVYSFFRNAARITIPRSTTFCLLLAFLVTATASTFIHVHSYEEAIQRTASWAMLLTVSFILPIAPHSPFERMEIWTRSLLVVGVALILVSLSGLYSPINYMSNRYRGPVLHPNHLAIFVTFPLLTALALAAVKRHTLRTTVLLIGVISAASFLIFLSDSRSGTISCVAGAVYMLLLGSTRKRLVLLTAGVCLAVALMTVLLYTAINQELPSTSHREYTLSNREGIWQRQVDAFLMSPWIGHGLELGTTENDGSVGRVGGEGSYTDLLSAAGLFGAGPLILACLLSLRDMKKSYRRTPLQYRAYYVAAVGCLTSVLTVAIGEGWLSAVGGVPPIVAWVYLGVFDTIAHLPNSSRVTGERTRSYSLRPVRGESTDRGRLYVG